MNIDMKIAVCDDEEYYRNQIADGIKENFQKMRIDTYKMDLYENGQSFLANEDRVKLYDAVFLDISMPDENGMQIADKLLKLNPGVQLVFITSYIDFAPAGYRLHALRYILKNELDVYLPEAIQAILRKTELQKLCVTYDFLEGKQAIRIHNLYYIESKKHKLEFHIQEDTPRLYTMYSKLDEIETQLKAYNFIRIHKSFLVNYRHVRGIKNYRMILENGEELMIPKKRFREVKEQYYELQGGLQ